jgi:hypothetical protein
MNQMVLVIYNNSIDDEVMEALGRAGMRCYTKFTNLRGVGDSSEPRLSTQVWPGTNSMLLVATDAQGREPILAAVRALKEIHREEGIRAFVLPLAEGV